ncbi:MAG: M24 family metallopeptidase [Acidobacteria bacterium]|nr:M24 family metallopeptidase [Acidobacteriota bacterium]
MQHAIDITAEAHMRSMGIVKRARTGSTRFRLEVEYTFRLRNADYWGYPSIVGCGPNATTLHYVESQERSTLTPLFADGRRRRHTTITRRTSRALFR